MKTSKKIIPIIMFFTAFITSAYGQKSQVLVIDPFLASTFLGGSNVDDMYEPTLILDKEGSVYISGFTSSQDFPTSEGAYDNSYNGGRSDCFIVKTKPKWINEGR